MSNRKEDSFKRFANDMDRRLKRAAVYASILTFLYIIVPGLFHIWRTSP